MENMESCPGFTKPASKPFGKYFFVLHEDPKYFQALHLGLFRSDYMLHYNNAELEIKQVEFNTISSSFGPLSHQVSALHRYLDLAPSCYVHPDIFARGPGIFTMRLAISEYHRI